MSNAMKFSKYGQLYTLYASQTFTVYGDMVNEISTGLRFFIPKNFGIKIFGITSIENQEVEVIENDVLSNKEINLILNSRVDRDKVFAKGEAVARFVVYKKRI